MSVSSLDSPGALRRFTNAYYRILCTLLATMLAILIIPVTVQIFSRFTDLIPHYIWTEEMARFLFCWTIMIGSIVAVREGAHFDVDLWPVLSPRGNALLRLFSRLCILIVAFVFLWMGIEFTEQAFYRTSELADLPLWVIHIAWPIAGASWTLFILDMMRDDLAILNGSRA
ncbi:C4-dicarboxylate ABC transporter substrate-binding protein [Bosea sp. Root381]|uniref:TRAP transporter small permease n=1 Tax=Bosea sp. Root381 TaxID=1736524 RepID=UPI0006F6C614|nr:TRAP transporter small permease [Bosea sp. Root381]KRE18144.1 C4-dicarboxylate ABC transporter substrate-binding protein [Bosea sp. Root381]